MWEWFLDLRATTSFAEIHAWIECQGVRPTAYEIGMLRRLGDAYQDHVKGHPGGGDSMPVVPEGKVLRSVGRTSDELLAVMRGLGARKEGG